MNEKISIIVPVYNAERTLKRCVESLIRQTYKNIEIILVNDGSTDRSLVICKKFEAQDKRIKVLDKPNGGVSSARNAGLDTAMGKYIMFCDSDDYVSEIWCSCLKDNYENENLAMCEFTEVKRMAPKLKADTNQWRTEKISKENFLFYRDQGIGSLTTKIFERKIIEENGIRLIKELSLGEDLIFVLKYLCCISGDITFLHIPLYYYIEENAMSLSKSVPSSKQCSIFYRELTDGMQKLDVQSPETWNYRDSILLSDYEKIFLELTARTDISFITKCRICYKIMHSETYGSCCKNGVVSKNNIYQWMLQKRKAFALMLFMKGQRYGTYSKNNG
ncbi:glycosyltransferase family 2 protein [Anaerostipes faecalis]|uniref:glycosyltransferase family 2 protein n=1 Tax=Anaerostipes faecalis TaxID=2738446 RepID=UPI003F079727